MLLLIANPCSNPDTAYGWSPSPTERDPEYSEAPKQKIKMKARLHAVVLIDYTNLTRDRMGHTTSVSEGSTPASAWGSLLVVQMGGHGQEMHLNPVSIMASVLSLLGSLPPALKHVR